jgi:hypothetical protein
MEHAQVFCDWWQQLNAGVGRMTGLGAVAKSPLVWWFAYSCPINQSLMLVAQVSQLLSSN